MRMTRRSRRFVVPRPSSTTHALQQARLSAGFSITQLARALRVHPRTVTRWEAGAARPRERQWSRVLELYVQRAPEVAQALAATAGRALPEPTRPVAANPNDIERVVAMAADTLDVAPKRVRQVLRAAALAATEVGVPTELLLAALHE